MIEKYQYIPIIKTTDAELRGYEELDGSVKDGVLPLFELTKSRKSKYNVEATVHKRIDSLKDIVGDHRPFILDITSHEDLANDEIYEFGDEINGFDNWCSFVESFRADLKLIPVIHMLPPEEHLDHEIKSQIERLAANFEYLAFRYTPFDFVDDGYMTTKDLVNEFTHYIELIKGSFDIEKLILVIDGQYIEKSLFNSKVSVIKELLSIFESNRQPCRTSITTSSFPSYVKGHEDDCYDDYGTLTILEKRFFRTICNEAKMNSIIYGDYASIHPVRKIQGGGNWVPRIDFPLSESIIYKRFRRDDGGYVRCGEKMAVETKFLSNPNPCWGEEQIKLASKGKPQGKSPSFWISVRLNLFISRLFLDGELPICHVK
ncbi:hypothetical protein THIAE_09640 [Thiomicrospira aerophila AL3]|uniref:Beta family protein n=1 Tax=Thiomicrospira aerophila AL3 TaxID=717772 RepID=W0DVC0_9GAMM|nr:beta family protein [Thiomicrospira aerophila]AHF02392.1 hypothetical protein THIAE_09640 [Thiomicrospira aerophila AL3]